MKNKKILTAVSLFMLLAASIFLKWMLTETVIYHSWPGWNDPFEFEKLNYLVDAVIVIILYSLLEKHVRSWAAKAALAFVHSAVYLVVLMSCNYGWGLLSWREIWDIPYFEYVKNELRYYFNYASPGFHWVFIAVFVACIGISVFRRIKQPLCLKAKNGASATSRIGHKIKNYLMKISRKEKTFLSKESIYSILLQVFGEYLSDEEFVEIREKYIDMIYDQAVYSIEQKFPGYIESLNNQEDDES